ncbi:XRE family transcriptional regulator [Pseudoalteromonas sp. Of7M-16]|uniref:XRE family transcriptional regulator n=1 Tax=Pseudoalteromonas sp. Of7M-16 TaxID=2917756 RepID=UPI001EF6F5AE|nr:XRE family transcriptional regulator [Pseudoalteromonas sp. Of7M-16]MCG7551601.1 helix-turn-helix transcriptional regulator [Pseudoalteromonas sp. Of7M-16]
MDDRYKELIANRLKQLRVNKGWTADETAKKLGISRSRYLNWECAARTPKLDMFPKIAKLFNTTAAYAAGFTDELDPRNQDSKFVSADQPKLNNNNLSLISSNIAFSIELLKNKALTSNDIILLKVMDGNMSPTLMKGDDALIDLSKTIVTEPDIFALQEPSGQIWFRWIRKELGGGYTVYANDKEHTKEQLFSESEFKKLDVLGRLCWSGRWS